MRILKKLIKNLNTETGYHDRIRREQYRNLVVQYKVGDEVCILTRHGAIRCEVKSVEKEYHQTDCRYYVLYTVCVGQLTFGTFDQRIVGKCMGELKDKLSYILSERNGEEMKCLIGKFEKVVL
jgi:hypothetical protein